MRTTNESPFTMAYWKTGNGYVGFVKEVRGAMSQGKTIEELNDRLNDAVKAIFESNRITSPTDFPTIGVDHFNEKVLV